MRSNGGSFNRKPSTAKLEGDEQRRERNRALDLLDALCCSGALPVYHAQLHVLLAATHVFDHSLLETLVQENINPMDQVERSSLIMASSICGKPVAELVEPGYLARVCEHSPTLLDRSSKAFSGLAS